jgi:glycosyltransferase involved in cell wall biosynthesis
MNFGITILFATHNGGRTLPSMIDALEKLQPPRRPVQIIAVDNASTDDTATILEQASQRLPIKRLYSPVPGKMPSLKLGAEQATGDLVLFTDDDVLPSPRWLVAFEEAVERYPDSFLFGGPITPVEFEPLSPWFLASVRHHAVLYARSEEREGDVDAVRHVYGPNFLTKREHLDVLAEIPAGLGPDFTRATTFAMGEDSLIIQRLTERGAKPKYVADAGVKHLVRAFQTDLGFMVERVERHGRGWSLQTLAASRYVNLTRARILLSNAIAVTKARLAAPRLAHPPTAGMFDSLWDIHWPLGAIKGALSWRRGD